MNSLSSSQQAFVAGLKRPFRLEPRPELPNVLAVLDEFSTFSFANTANLWLVNPNRPEIDFDFINPDFLLIESAWSGNGGQWRYMITSSKGPKEPLIKLVNNCNRRGIPTVFWNKEDPPHFEEFISTARLFDFVFTSDANMIESYNSRIPGVRAELLRFAAAPELHSPERVDGYRERNFAFAGQYFSHKFPERREQMEVLFPEAAKFGLDIYSRALGGDPRYQFPAPFDSMVVGSLPYNQMVRAYKRYKAFINVNSVVNSKTMCARRVFELSACKTGVVGMESEAVRSVYTENEISLADSSEAAFDIFQMFANDPRTSSRMTQLAWRRTLSEHTYEHRMKQILEILGIASIDPSIEVRVHSLDGEMNDDLLENLRNQKFTFERKVKLILDETNTLATSSGAGTLSEESSLSFDLWVNPGYEYGPYYLNDLILSQKQTKASIVAKVLPNDSSTATESFSEERLPEWGGLVLRSDAERSSGVYFADQFELGRCGKKEMMTIG